DRRVHAEPREPGGDVAGEAADEARVRPHLGERRLELVGIEIDPHAPHHDGLDHRWLRSSRRAASYSARAARTDSGRATSATGRKPCGPTVRERLPLEFEPRVSTG